MWFRNIFRAKRAPSSPAKSGSGFDLNLSPFVLRQLDRLQLHAGRSLPGANGGLRASDRRKPSFDFRDHRAYVPGDDVRYIDWKASARQEHIFIRQGEQPKDAAVYLLLDTSASMSWGDPPKRLTQLQVAAALGYLALSHGDRLTVLPFGETVSPPFGPASGKGQAPNLINYLRAQPYAGRTALGRAVLNLSGRAARGGLVIVLSDFLDTTGLDAALQRLPAPAWDVIFLQILHPEEINPRRKGDFEVVDIETGRKANYDLDHRALQRYAAHRRAWQDRLEALCEGHNAFFTTIQSGGALETAIIPHLVSVHVLRPL
jgi:uncharacterized protein (DUF58 family)